MARISAPAAIHSLRSVGAGWSRLSWTDRLEAARVVALVVAVECGLRLATLPRLAGALRVVVDLDSPEAGRPRQEPLPAWATRRLQIARGVLAHRPGGPTCLRASLVYAARLRPLHPMVRIGIERPPGSAVRAHAWVEIDGRYLDPAAARFGAIHSPTR